MEDQGVKHVASESEIVQTALDGLLKESEGETTKDESNEKGSIQAGSPETFLGSFARRQELYEQGLSDSAIAREEGVSRSAMRRNLPRNSHLKSFPRRQELYEQGLSDYAIAQAESVANHVIWMWRKRRNLPPNLPSPQKHIAVKSYFIKEYLRYLEDEGSSVVNNHKCCLAMFENFLKGKPLEKVAPRDVWDFLNNLMVKRRAKGTISHYFSTIKSFYEYLDLCHDIDVSELRRKLPELRRQIKKYRSGVRKGVGREPLTRDEVRRLINAPDSLRDTLLLSMLCYTGIRAGEAAGLKIEKVDTKRREIEVVGKGDKPRRVPYHLDLDRLIDRWLNKVRRSYVNSGNSDYFFVSKSGAKLTVPQIRKIVNKAAEKASIQKVVLVKLDGAVIYKVKPHVLRHTFATHLDEDFANASEDRIIPREDIQQILGHEQMSTTREYIHSDVRFKSYCKHFKAYFGRNP